MVFLVLYDIEPGQIDLLTVDVEGREADVFEGFDLYEWFSRPMIIELEDEHESFQKYQKITLRFIEHLEKRFMLLGMRSSMPNHINTIICSKIL